MDPRIGSLWLLSTCVGIVMISCYISGVACDVPDDVVYTDLHKTVRIGDSVVLKCQFRGTPLAVYWKKGDDPQAAPTLVSWITGDPVTGSCVGERTCQIMEMNAEFSLIIKAVSIVEQGLYVCRVTNYKGSQIHNFTDISVFSPPKEPYPIINECQMISPNNTKTTCTISTSQSVEISCSASGYFPDINLHFLHGSTSLHTKDTIEVTNVDGTKNKTIYANATASEISYICFASIPGLQEQRTTTVLVNLRTSSFPTIPIDKTDGSVAKVVVPVIFNVLAVICISIILLRRWKRQRSQGTYAKVPSMRKIDGIISYFELEKLVKKFDVGSLRLIVAELMGDSKGELESELKKGDLYKYLCEWKENSSGSAILLYSAMEKYHLENELQIFEDFLASADNAVSDDDLEHICWHVHSCRETVQPIVSSLQYSSTNSTKPADSGHISTPSRYDDIRDDLQIMKRWKAMSAATTYGDGDEHTESMLSNQMIQLCRALEKAGKKTGDSDGQVYHQLSKTFYKIQGEYKSELTDEVLKEFALSITKRHCQRLGKTLKHSADAIATRNEEDLNIFGTDIMLKAWVQDQKCSNYEIRRRLRQAAGQCNRQDIADNFIRKEQSEVMASTMKLQARLTIANEELSSGASGSESRFEISLGDVIEVENRVCKAQLAKQLGVSDDVQSTGPDNQVKDDTLHQSALLRWRDTVRSSTFNHRLVLADALFSMGEEQLALDIISGVYRKRVINNQVNELLLANILEGRLPTLDKILDQTKKNEEKELNGKSPRELSNELLGAGFYAFAHEFMAVFDHETETGNVETEELRQGGIAINEPVMQEKSGDGAAESKENTTENVDTKEQDGLDECRRDESSKLLIQA